VQRYGRSGRYSWIWLFREYLVPKKELRATVDIERSVREPIGELHQVLILRLNAWRTWSQNHRCCYKDRKCGSDWVSRYIRYMVSAKQIFAID
jgi:hypothetical protein